MNNPRVLEHFGKKNSIFCEKTSSKPVEGFVPGQAVKLSELFDRFTKGQRLNIHINPMNEFFPEDQVEKHTEPFEAAPPEDIQDIVDVEEYHKSVQEHKREFHERQKSKRQKSESKAEKAPQEANDAALEDKKQ